MGTSAIIADIVLTAVLVTFVYFMVRRSERRLTDLLGLRTRRARPASASAAGPAGHRRVAIEVGQPPGKMWDTGELKMTMINTLPTIERIGERLDSIDARLDNRLAEEKREGQAEGFVEGIQRRLPPPNAVRR